MRDEVGEFRRGRRRGEDGRRRAWLGFYWEKGEKQRMATGEIAMERRRRVAGLSCPLGILPMRHYWSELMKEEGSGGVGIWTAPSSICVTLSMVGRIVGSSWRHHRATATKRSAFFMLKFASSSPSTNKSILPHL